MKKLYALKKSGISFVIGTYNRKKYLKATIRSIRNELFDVEIQYEIIIIDGGSTDGTLKWLSKQKDIIVILQHNRGKWKNEKIERRSWGYFMNLGFKLAKGKYICMLSDDCILIPGAIKNGYEQFEEELIKGNNLAAIAFFWREYPPIRGNIYWVGSINEKIFVNHGMYLRESLEKINFAEEDLYRFYYSDGDLCLRLWKNGYKCVESRNSFVEHFSHINNKQRRSNYNLVEEDKIKFEERWGKINNSHKTLKLQRLYNDDKRTYAIFKRISPILLLKIAIIKNVIKIKDIISIKR